MTQRRRTSKPDHVNAMTASDDRARFAGGQRWHRGRKAPRIRPRNTRQAIFDGRWFTRYRETVECDYYGRRVFRFHRRFPHPPIETLDVLFAVSVAVAVLALSDSVSFDVDHIELYLRSGGAIPVGSRVAQQQRLADMGERR